MSYKNISFESAPPHTSCPANYLASRQNFGLYICYIWLNKQCNLINLGYRK